MPGPFPDLHTVFRFSVSETLTYDFSMCLAWLVQAFTLARFIALRKQSGTWNCMANRTRLVVTNVNHFHYEIPMGNCRSHVPQRGKTNPLEQSPPQCFHAGSVFICQRLHIAFRLSRSPLPVSICCKAPMVWLEANFARKCCSSHLPLFTSGRSDSTRSLSVFIGRRLPHYRHDDDDDDDDDYKLPNETAVFNCRLFIFSRCTLDLLPHLLLDGQFCFARFQCPSFRKQTVTLTFRHSSSPSWERSVSFLCGIFDFAFLTLSCIICIFHPSLPNNLTRISFNSF